MNGIKGYILKNYSLDVEFIEEIPTKYNTNQNYKINILKNPFFLKMYSTAKSYMTEKWFLDTLNKKGCTPQIVGSSDGDNQNKPSLILPYYENYISLSKEYILENKDIAFLLGQALRELHRIDEDTNFFGRIFDDVQYNNWLDYLSCRIQKIKSLCVNSNCDTINKKIISIEGNISALKSNVRPSYIHGDLNPDNIMFNPKTKKFIFIDFERSYIGNFMMDLPKLFWRTFDFNDELIKSFKFGYGENIDYQELRIYKDIFFVDLYSYLINLTPKNTDDIGSIHEIIKILEN